jgi:hypothetical protein
VKKLTNEELRTTIKRGTNVQYDFAFNSLADEVTAATELLALRSERRRLRAALKEIRSRANVGGAIKDIADKALHPVPKKRGMR